MILYPRTFLDFTRNDLRVVISSRVEKRGKVSLSIIRIKFKQVLKVFSLLLIVSFPAQAQLKFVVEDFEGLADGTTDLKTNGVFVFGNMEASIEHIVEPEKIYSGQRSLRLNKKQNLKYGGWGKGIGLNIELDVNTDNLNFYFHQPENSLANTIRIELQEDDNGNNIYEKEADDSWVYIQKMENKNNWELVSIPLNKFKDDNLRGDGVFNISYKQGKLFCFTITFVDSDLLKSNDSFFFDFICFSKGKLPTDPELFKPSPSSTNNFCELGAWSKEGNMANFTDIALNFENNFKPTSDKKLSVVHFFQPFAVDGGTTQNFYPSVERINKVIKSGYLPMITLEDHFVNAKPTVKQPNLYSIVEGHLDIFFRDWAKQIKQVEGTVMLRILHEFNGDWYPWCIANNDKNPDLFVNAFRHIRRIFREQQVTNVKFIWCPNSMSLPQESWNYIMDAYPGDEYVDYVGLDIYNGAGKSTTWRSFRKEGIENYFVITEQLSNKPLFICEVASRERTAAEPKLAQNKADWIRQMSEALTSDMSKIKLLVWFNEKKTFRIDSSPEAKNAFLNYVLRNDHFKSGMKYLGFILHH